MTASLRDHFDLLVPPPGALIDASQRARLAALSRRLPPIPRVAVECRLAAQDTQVDLQQCVCCTRGYRLLAEHFRSFSDGDGGTCPLFGVADFFSELAREGSRLNLGIDEVFLEYDVPPDATAPTAPSVFFSLREVEPAEARATVATALQILGVTDRCALDACFAACAADAHVSHVGAMLSRPAGIIRVNIKGLRTGEAAGFLTACGWPGDVAAAAALFEWALDRVDRVTLALDAGERLLPRIGVECFLDEQPDRDTAWTVLARELCADGLCSTEKACALMGIPADITPRDLAGGWPPELVAESLRRPPNEFSAYARRLAHFKLTLNADGSREAKAYFAAVHHWTSQPPPAACAWRPALGTPRPRRSLPRRSGAPVPILRAIEGGVDFLVCNQLQSGFWKDFASIGVSDEWVTAFVACQLASTRDTRALTAAREAFERLARRQRECGGWAYNRMIPPDADSTSWVLRLAAALNVTTEATVRARRFVGLHSVGGAVTSYLPRALEKRGSDGWLAAHDCVTAAAAPFVPSAANALRERQHESGGWSGYWWQHGAYVTALAVEALRDAGGEEDDARLASARGAAERWLYAAMSSSGGSAFDIAWCLRTLVGASGDSAKSASAAGAAHLIAAQLSDGSWAPGAMLRMPEPMCIDPDAAESFVCPDHHGNFTTAAVIGALCTVEP
jgi:hypothetical protein